MRRARPETAPCSALLAANYLICSTNTQHDDMVFEGMSTLKSRTQLAAVAVWLVFVVVILDVLKCMLSVLLAHVACGRGQSPGLCCPA
jgi:hypothetical protein